MSHYYCTPFSSSSSSSSSSSPSSPSSSSSSLQSTLLLSYSLSGKLHTIEENPFEELYEHHESNLLDEDVSADTCSDSDFDSDSDELRASTTLHKGKTAIPRPRTLLLHATQYQNHAHSPPSSWRFPRTSPSQNYALSVLRYAYALSSRQQNTQVGRDVIWSSGTRWY